MEPFQQRVVEEKTELDAKLDKLTPFLLTDTFRVLSLDEQTRLRRQAEAMANYSEILQERIANF